MTTGLKNWRKKYPMKNWDTNSELKNMHYILNLGSRWPGSLFRLMVDLFCQLYSPINGITCRTKYNVHTKNIIWKCLLPFINTKSEDDAHKPIVRIINQYWWNYEEQKISYRHITKHQTCLQTFTLASMLQLSVTMMSWVQVWVDLRLFTTQFSDKVLLDTWKLKEWEWNKFWEGFG